MIHAHEARQAHRYQLGDRIVMAMQSGHVVEVREIDHTQAYPLGSKPIVVKASWLKPLPMAYFHDEVPK